MVRILKICIIKLSESLAILQLPICWDHSCFLKQTVVPELDYSSFLRHNIHYINSDLKCVLPLALCALHLQEMALPIYCLQFLSIRCLFY